MSGGFEDEDEAMNWLVIWLGLGSALGSAVSTTLKRASASRVPSVQGGGVRGLGRFITATATSPFYLLALLGDVAGFGLQVIALHYGALALVQPLLISGLVFALLLRHVGRWHFSAAELVWALVLVGSLVGFLLLSGAAATSQPARADRGDAVIAAVAVGVGVLVLLVVAQRSVPPAGRAALLGVAVGAVYATSAALIKASTVVVADHGLVALLTSWQLYTTIAVAVSGLLLAQIAFQAGPITTSLPAVATIDPLLSVLIGVVIYGEHLRHGPASGAVLIALLVLLVVAVIKLARVESVDLPDAPARDADRRPGVAARTS